MTFDISNLLKPVTVRSRFLGMVEVDARTQTFYDWFREGRIQKRWPDSRAFVRSLLGEKTNLKPTGKPLKKTEIDALTSHQVDAFAKAFIRAAGALIIPRFIDDGAPSRLRKRREGEEYPSSRQANEDESARLFRLLSDLDEEHRAQDRQRLADLRKMLRGPADLLRQIDPIGDQINELKRGILGPSLWAQMEAERITTVRSQVEAQARSDADAISRAIDVAILGRSHHALAIQQYGLLTSQLADRESQISRAMSAFQLAMGTSKTVAEELRGELARQQAWGESVKKFLNPSLSSGLLASMVGVHHNIAASDAIEAVAGLSRGFMTTANLGLLGATARGATADVLSQYRADSSRHSDLFRDVMRAIQEIDTDEINDSEFIKGLNEARLNVSRIDLRDPVQAQSFLALIMLLLMVYQTVLQQESLKFARSSATSSDVESVRIEVSALNNNFRKAREEDQREWREVRYVANLTPLRIEPDRNSVAVLTVYPDQFLRILEVRGAWARVEVIVYHSGSVQTGWVSRERLRTQPAR